MDDAVPVPTPGPPPGRRVETASDLGADLGSGLGSEEAVAAGLDALLAPLEGIDGRPVAEHPAAYEQVHGRLRAVLAGEPVTGDAGPRA